jgi:hypothetical protein
VQQGRRTSRRRRGLPWRASNWAPKLLVGAGAASRRLLLLRHCRTGSSLDDPRPLPDRVGAGSLAAADRCVLHPDDDAVADDLGALRAGNGELPVGAGAADRR